MAHTLNQFNALYIKMLKKEFLLVLRIAYYLAPPPNHHDPSLSAASSVTQEEEEGKTERHRIQDEELDHKSCKLTVRPSKDWKKNYRILLVGLIIIHVRAPFLLLLLT